MTVGLENHGRLRRTIWFALLALVPIGVIQLWISTAGWAAWSRGSNYVAMQADAFVHGRLSLMKLPDAKLLALPDPYDPLANGPYRMQDAILYHGKFYLYWGPAPAILTAAVCKVLRLRPDFGDQYLVFAFMVGMVILAAVLMLRIKMRLFPGLGIGAIVPPVLSLGMGTPALFMLARPAIYEATITAGQFFLLAGFLAAFEALAAPAESRRGEHRWLTLAGILFSLSAASRLSLIPGIAAAVAVTLWHLRRRGRLNLTAFAGPVLPLAATVALLCFYNRVRFGSFTEFGLRWQLAGRNPSTQSAHDLFRLWYFAIDAWCYLLNVPAWLGAFPFVHAVVQKPPFMGASRLPDGFGLEPLVGLIWSQPFLMFALLGERSRLNRSRPVSTPMEEVGRLNTWLVGSLCAAGVIGFAPALFFEGATMRYLLDGVPCWTILAAMGYWRVLTSPRVAVRRAVCWGAGIVVGAQAVLGILLGITGYNGNFAFYNPQLFQAMKGFFGGM